MSSSASTPSRLLLLDGHSLAYRAFYALPAEKFVTAAGQHTNAVYGFTAMLINLLRDEQPTHIAAAFDVGRESFRTEQYSEYKATRQKTPDEFAGQIELIIEVLSALGVTSLTKPGFEADDILATLSTRADEEQLPALIVTGDRDAFQLITDTTTVLYPKHGASELARMNDEAVREKYGVPAAQYRELAALVGETSDNLPGVPKVGPKTAAKWLTRFGSLDALLEHAEEITGKVGESLREHREDVQRNRELNYLLRDLDLSVSLSDLLWRGIEREQMHRVFDTLQFRTLRSRLNETLSLEDADSSAEGSVTIEPTLTPYTAGQVGAWLREFTSTKAPTGVAVEGSWGAGAGEIRSLALSTESGAVVFPFTALSEKDYEALSEWLSDEQHIKVWHDVKGPMLALKARNVELCGVSVDTAVYAYLLRPDQRSYDLDDLTRRFVERELPEKPAAQQQLSFDGLSEETAQQQQYLAAAAEATRLLAALLAEKVEGVAATQLAEDVEMPLVSLLATMEHDGIAVSHEQLEQLHSHFESDAHDAANTAHQIVGREFNVGSPKQLQAVLFDELQLPKTRRIKTGYTTDAGALQTLYVKTQHPVLEQLLRHREVTKLKTTVEGLLRAVQSDGRIHTTFNQLTAATGRLSSLDPNLQNIPVRTEEGRWIREAFIPGRGYTQLLTADYSQLELRIMAHLSDDTELQDAFASGEDLHTTVGARVFSVSSDSVDASMRRRVKAMSYGLAYGLGAYGLSNQLEITTQEATELMEEYFKRFGGVRHYLEGVVEQARGDGYTSTLLGRRRHLPDLGSSNRQRREMAERMALNAPIQGSAADIMKIAMLRIVKTLRAEGLRSRMVIQVHDEVLCEIAEGEAARVTEIVQHEMSTAYPLRVPLDVSVGIGDTWDSAAH